MIPPKTVALFPEASFGAALNCVGIAQELRRDHLVSFQMDLSECKFRCPVDG